MNEFLDKLQSSHPSSFGTEGYRTVLREIYRHGTISLRMLSFSTNIPAIQLTSMINFLTERDLLARHEDGILFTAKGMEYLEEVLGFYGFGLDECEICEGSPIYASPRWDDFYEIINELVSEQSPREEVSRPIPETLALRAIYLYDKGILEGKRACFLGDQFLLGCACAYLYKGVYPEEKALISEELTFASSDQRVQHFLWDSIGFGERKVVVKNWSPERQVPLDLLHRFDAVVFRFSNSSKEAIKFLLSRVISLLKESENKDVVCILPSFTPEEIYWFQKIALSLNLFISDVEKRLQAYFAFDPLYDSNSEALVLLKTSRSAESPVLPTEVANKNLIYSSNYRVPLEAVWCQSCEKTAILGNHPDAHEKDYAKLKKNGCPFCGSNIGFMVDVSDAEPEDPLVSVRKHFEDKDEDNSEDIPNSDL